MTLFLAKSKQFRFFYHCGYIPNKFEHCTSNSVTNKNVTLRYRTGYEGDCKAVSLMTLSKRFTNSLNSSQIQSVTKFVGTVHDYADLMLSQLTLPSQCCFNASF